MKKLSYLIAIHSILNFCVTLHAMKTAPAILTENHIAKFVDIVSQNRPFENALPHIKELAERKPEWKQFLSDARSVGDLIVSAYENYEKNGSYTTKAEISYLLDTTGAHEWCKNYLLTNDWEVKCLKKQMLVAAERDDRATISAILNVGIDVNSTDPGNIDEESPCCLEGLNPMLISAIQQPNRDLATFLLVEKSANPNIRANQNGLTPLIMSIQLLHKADKNKSYEKFHILFSIICLLMNHSLLDLKAVDSDKKSALDYATEYNMNWLQAMIALDNFNAF